MSDYIPQKHHKFTFGLWTVGNVGRDPFGNAVREPLAPTYIVKKLSELGAYGVNLHDNDLVPIDATAAERDRIVAEFKKALDDYGMRVPMATTNLFYDPVFKDGAFTSNDPKVRAYALQKTMRAMDLGAELGAEVYVFWGGREGVETDASKDPREALKRYRECLNFLAEYDIEKGYNFKFAIEPKPNEPRGDIYLPVVGAALGFIATLNRPEKFGLNPEYAHETMAGLNFVHAVAQAIDAGKLFHIDLNGQKIGRYDQDYRFGAEDLKTNFFLVKLLEESGYEGMRHFDAHAYRTEDEEGVWDFARGCMRTYLILKEKAERFNADPEIQGLLHELNTDSEGIGGLIRSYSPSNAQRIMEMQFDRAALGKRGYAYEKLDQLTMEILLGVR
ncbi:xylose isomerase [Chthonomonas calidirosea]|uniref:xylose isomerase n=1 Tax=Chthonomonas calidirosea TaxID=454171 RepID=UPI0006DD5187|nr:xylose isomerase [Chthonomonas calidirosea]CEK12404.1 xylose isomerase [Chthonomonas calidirosea]